MDLLPRLVGTVHVPEAVYQEIIFPGQTRAEVRSLMHADWIVRHQVKDRPAVERLGGKLGQGEAEAIVLARELRANIVILDDATARRIAEAEGQEVIGLLGLLLHAKDGGLLETIRPTLDRLISAGFYVDDRLYHTILQHAGEQS